MINVHQLFIEVTSRGGIEKVIKERKCKEVIGAFNYNATATNAAFVLRKFYLKMLFKFEHVYYFQEPISSFVTKEEAVKLLGNKPAKHEKGTQELQIGSVVDGVIDGKFDKGYLVTVNVGSEEFGGVLYHVTETETSSRKRKKKSKSSQVDPQRPTGKRSGYNFFFSDNYLKLKPKYVGQDITKEIGRMWRNLSAPEKQVYLQKGIDDVERYKREISEYDSCGMNDATVAATTEAGMTDATVAATTELVAAEIDMTDAEVASMIEEATIEVDMTYAAVVATTEAATAAETKDEAGQ